MTSPRSAAAFQALLGHLYEGLEALDTSTYQSHTSDHWSRAPHPTADGSGEVGHLEAYFWMGNQSDYGASLVTYDAVLVFHVRSSPDDDSLSQGMAHAAAWAAQRYLQDWSYDDGSGTQPTGYDIERASAEWLRISIACTLTLQR